MNRNNILTDNARDTLFRVLDRALKRYFETADTAGLELPVMQERLKDADFLMKVLMLSSVGDDLLLAMRQEVDRRLLTRSVALAENYIDLGIEALHGQPFAGGDGLPEGWVFHHPTRKTWHLGTAPQFAGYGRLVTMPNGPAVNGPEGIFERWFAANYFVEFPPSMASRFSTATSGDPTGDHKPGQPGQPSSDNARSADPVEQIVDDFLLTIVGPLF